MIHRIQERFHKVLSCKSCKSCLNVSDDSARQQVDGHQHLKANEFVGHSQGDWQCAL